LNLKPVVLCTFLAALIFSSVWLVEPARSQTQEQVITILPDGSVSPATPSIQRNGNTYLFTGDVNARGISIQKAGITIDGAGHVLLGPYNGTQSLWIIGNGPNQTVTNDSELWSTGIDAATGEIGNLTIQNLNVENFSIGIYLWTAGNIVRNNAFVEGIVGILVSGADNTITSNYIADNKNGVFFGSIGPNYLPTNIQIYENRFVNNIRQLSGCVCVDYNLTEPEHYWDNGTVGNYWSDYNGTEIGHTGIGSTPYIIDPLNMDRFPLTTSTVSPPTPPTDIHIDFAIGALIAVVVIAAVVIIRRRTKKPMPSILNV